jgi:acyl-CoA synthetase (AMP-forming)/AMP-acid ligase II
MAACDASGGPGCGVHDLLAAATARHPRRLAIVDGALRLSYAELADRVATLAAALEPHVSRGGSIAALGPPSVAQLEFVFVAALLGALFVPLNFRWTDAEIAAALIDCDASAFVVDDIARLEALSAHLPVGAIGVVVVASPPHALLAPAAAAAPVPSASCARGVTTVARLLCAVPAALAVAGLCPRPAAHDWGTEGAGAPHSMRAAGCGEEDAWLVYTSGTTGGPKGVSLSHASALAHAAFKTRALALDRTAPCEGGGGGEAAGCQWAGATYLAAAPLHHVAGLSALAAVVRAAGCVVVPRSTRARDLRAALLAGRAGPGQGEGASSGAPAVDLLVVVPAHLHALVFGDAADGDAAAARALGPVSAAVRTVLLGGGYPTEALVAGCFRAFPNASLTLTYAQTEAGSTICTLPRPRPPAAWAAAPPAAAAERATAGGGAAAARLAAAVPVGSAAPFVELAIRDEVSGLVHQRALEVGEILVRGGGIFSGYRRDPAATERALRDGWLHTGDLGALAPAPSASAGGAAASERARASLLFIGRRADVVKTGGEAVDAAEVERALCSVDSVAEAAVVGVPDSRLGERLVAVLVAAADAPPAGPARDAAVAQACRRLLAGFKLPRALLWWPTHALPRTASGKVIKWRLRQDVARALDERAAAGTAGTTQPVGPTAAPPRARL